MKKLHKKIGAVALAGMVVAGGVAASGGKSHAAGLISRLPQSSIYNAGLSSLSNADYWSVREAQEIVKEVSPKGRVVAVAYSSSSMNNFIKNSSFFKKPHVIKRLLDQYPIYYGNRDVLKIGLRNANSRGQKFVKCRYDNLIFLFLLN